MTQNSSVNLLAVENIKKTFAVKDTYGKKTKLKALDGISFSIKPGETFGIVGESGCGKSTLGRVILNLHIADSGKVYFENKDVTHVKGKDRKSFCRQNQIIFQDPAASLNPRKRIMNILAEPFRIHTKLDAKQRNKEIDALLDMVGLSAEYKGRYPHEMSGGQKQRIGIARAIALHPKFIVCDEPVSALDVSIQAQVINLLIDLQKKLDLTYLFISHDLGVVRHICARVGVMYLGNMVETADTDTLYNDTKHPYTKALISAAPTMDQNKQDPIVLTGDVPNPSDPPSGCKFHTRCPYAMKQCKEKEPNMLEINPGHFVACHLYAQDAESI